MAWVYILYGSRGRHYIGSTEDLQRRFAEHQRGKVHSTRRFGQPLELVASRSSNRHACSGKRLTLITREPAGHDGHHLRRKRNLEGFSDMG
jgi:predicted GIY-YIG superfamily endonuclease